MIRSQRLLDSFLRYVQIDSESGHERAMGETLMADAAALGLAPEADDAGKTFGSDGFNVFFRFPGTLPGEPILLTAHMDTVVPGRGIRPYVEDGVIRSGPDTILGGDDKSGICAILEAVTVILERGLPHRPAEILFTIGEEGGLRGAKAFDMSRLESRRAFVFDSSGEVGKIIVEAPGQVKLRAEVIGRRAHAGVAPEKGISAIQAAARGVAKMNLLRIDEETTCNIGTFKSEYATNVVPERASLLAEVRSRDPEKLIAQTEHLCRCLQEACDEAGARLELEKTTSYHAYSVAPDSPTAALALAAAERIGVKGYTARSGGGSDANVFNRNGLEAVVLATGMTNGHTTDEYLTVDSLEMTARWALSLLTGR